MSDIAIKVAYLSKKYIIGHGQSGSLRDIVTLKWRSLSVNYNTKINSNFKIQNLLALTEQVLGVPL